MTKLPTVCDIISDWKWWNRSGIWKQIWKRVLSSVQKVNSAHPHSLLWGFSFWNQAEVLNFLSLEGHSLTSSLTLWRPLCKTNQEGQEPRSCRVCPTMMGKVFLMAFTMQLCPQVSPTPTAFHKNIPYHRHSSVSSWLYTKNVVGGSPKQQTLTSKGSLINITGWLKGTCSTAMAQTS